MENPWILLLMQEICKTALDWLLFSVVNLLKYSTFFVLKLEILRKVNEVQFLNIFLILITFTVSKADKLIFFNEIQLQNISLIDSTFSVLKLDKSTEVKELHPSNIPSI